MTSKIQDFDLQMTEINDNFLQSPCSSEHKSMSSLRYLLIIIVKHRNFLNAIFNGNEKMDGEKLLPQWYYIAKQTALIMQLRPSNLELELYKRLS